MKAGKFGLEDLKMNQEGKLSPSQKRKMLFFIFLNFSLLMVTFGLTLFLAFDKKFQEVVLFSHLWLFIALYSVVLVTLILAFHYLIIVEMGYLRKAVISLEGEIKEKGSVPVVRGKRLFYIIIRNYARPLILPSSKIWQIFNEGESYKIYFIPRKKQFYNRREPMEMVLSLEPLEG